MTAPPMPRESIFETILRTGRIEEAITAVCGRPVKTDHKRFLYKCPHHGLGDGEDSNASLYVMRDTGFWGCICGAHTHLGGGTFATLGVHFGFGAATADVAHRLDEMFGHRNGHSTSEDPDPSVFDDLPSVAPAPAVEIPGVFPFFPETAAALGFELVENRAIKCSKCDAACTEKLLRIPTTFPGFGAGPDRWRGPRHDCKPKAMFVAGYPNAVVHGLINWKAVLSAVAGAPDAEPIVFLTAGETDLLALVHHATKEGLCDSAAAFPAYCTATGEKATPPKFDRPEKAEAHLETLRHVQLVILADNDGPGRDAANGLASNLDEQDITVAVVLPPSGKDIREYLVSGGTVRELFRLAEKALTAEEAPPDDTADPDIHLTDTGNAHLFQRDNGADVRFVNAEKAWYVWSGAGTWSPDDTGSEVRRAMATLRTAQRAAMQLTSKRKRKAHFAHYLESESEPGIRRMLTLARSLPGIAAAPADFDRDPSLLCCANGVVNLRTGELLPHSRDHLFTRASPVAFDPAAKCPRFERFLEEIFPNDTALSDWVRLAIGYSATGDTREQCAFFLLGDGANGKSVLVETIRYVLGGFTAAADIETFVNRENQRGPSNDLARLAHVRLVASSEPEEGAALAEGFLKSITGGETITARFLFREHFEFQPQFKLWISTNVRPKVRGTDNGIWRRIRLIPFRVTFPEERQDQQLLQTLRGEATGILAWIIRAAVDWYERGLPLCDSVRAATQEYRSEQDIFGQFLADRCSIGAGPIYEVKAADLYRAYLGWAADNGEKPWTHRAVSRHLHAKGFNRRKTGGNTVWTGVRLSDGSEDGLLEMPEW